jgi:hypothetical protein
MSRFCSILQRHRVEPAVPVVATRPAAPSACSRRCPDGARVLFDGLGSTIAAGLIRDVSLTTRVTQSATLYDDLVIIQPRSQVQARSHATCRPNHETVQASPKLSTSEQHPQRAIVPLQEQREHRHPQDLRELPTLRLKAKPYRITAFGDSAAVGVVQIHRPQHAERRASSSESLIVRTPSAMCASTTHGGSDPSSSAPTYIDTCDHLDCVRRLTSSVQRVLPALSSTSPRHSTLASACWSAVVSIENSSTGFAR